MKKYSNENYEVGLLICNSGSNNELKNKNFKFTKDTFNYLTYEKDCQLEKGKEIKAEEFCENFKEYEALKETKNFYEEKMDNKIINKIKNEDFLTIEELQILENLSIHHGLILDDFIEIIKNLNFKNTFENNTENLNKEDTIEKTINNKLEEKNQKQKIYNIFFEKIKNEQDLSYIDYKRLSEIKGIAIKEIKYRLDRMSFKTKRYI